MLDFLKDMSPAEAVRITELLQKSGSSNADEALIAQKAVAAALVAPLRQGILTGDIIGPIFNPEPIMPGARTDYPVDFFRPDNAGEFVAYTMPNHGAIPQKHVEGDYVSVPTFPIGSSIDFLLRYARDARWNIVARAMEVLEAGFVKKMNNDGWHTILAAAHARGIIVSDSNAAAGQLTKELISLLKTVMRRNAGGNSTSVNRGRLTHLYVSPEAVEDMRNWGIDQVDEITRREIYVANDGTFQNVFGVQIVDLDELGDNQEYQTYYETVTALGDTNSGMASATDVEIVVGLDLSKKDSFVMPVVQEVEIFEDPKLHREQRQGYYGWGEAGYGVLNGTRALLGSL